MGKVRKVYPSDVTEEEWWFVLPCREDAGRREHALRDVFARCGTWHLPAVRGAGFRVICRRGPRSNQQFRRWLDAGVLEALVADVQSIAREWAGRKGQPTAICIDSRTLQSRPESGARVGYDGAKRRKDRRLCCKVSVSA